MLGWFDTLDEMPVQPEKVFKSPSKKVENIPVLRSYRGTFSDEFWDKFPFRDLPTSIKPKLDVGKLSELTADRSSAYHRGISQSKTRSSFSDGGRPLISESCLASCLLRKR